MLNLNMSFNSNMVRLRGEYSMFVSGHILFQFQYGAIKSNKFFYTAFNVPSAFQFQYGAIKSILFSTLIQSSLRFNSNMVRLREKGEFTIQKINQRFNSNMVRLRDCFESNSCSTCCVSIPIWCD